MADPKTGGFVKKAWKEIKVGSVIKVLENEFLPADLILLNSSGPKGICYIETKNLDGETNLKHKVANKDVMAHFTDEKTIATFNATCQSEGPSDKIYQFDGIMIVGDQRISLSYENFLLRGSSLKQTDYVYGVAVFTGHTTRIMKNSTGARTKFSRVEKQTNMQIFIIFALQCVLCLIATAYSIYWRQLNMLVTESYLDLQGIKGTGGIFD